MMRPVNVREDESLRQGLHFLENQDPFAAACRTTTKEQRDSDLSEEPKHQ